MNFVFISHGIPRLLVNRMEEMVGKTSKDIKILYITTPANTYPEKVDWLVEAMNEIKSNGFQMDEYTIETETPENIIKQVNSHDIVWISGGNVFYFMYWAAKKGLKEILKDYLLKGGVYAGESAGVVCQIRDLEPIKWADNPNEAPEIINEGMQLTDVVVIPHWGWEKYASTMKRIGIIMYKKE